MTSFLTHTGAGPGLAGANGAAAAFPPLHGSAMPVAQDRWERLEAERRLLTTFWVTAAGRAQMLLQPQNGMPGGPHSWSLGAPPPPGALDNGHATPGHLAGGVATQGMGGGIPTPSMGSGMPPPGTGGAADPQAFLGRVVNDLSGAMTGVLCAVGVRLGLFTELADGGPVSAPELAARTGLGERHLSEWLRGLAAAGYVERAGDGRFALPPAQAAVLGTPGSPLNMSAGFALLAALAASVDVAVEAFQTDSGVPQERYPANLVPAMEHMSASWLDTMLVQQWLPAIDGLVANLAAGGTVADIGCGGGRALVLLAQEIPKAHLIGFDLHEGSVARARQAAEQAGVADRVRIEHGDGTAGLPEGLDLVTLFDVLHDAPDPEGLLRAIRSALHPEQGVLLVLESRAQDDEAANVGPAAAILYATSTLYCVPTALADGGPGLGTLGLPPRQMERLATAAGFAGVEPIPIASPFNTLYALRP